MNNTINNIQTRVEELTSQIEALQTRISITEATINIRNSDRLKRTYNVSEEIQNQNTLAETFFSEALDDMQNRFNEMMINFDERIKAKEALEKVRQSNRNNTLSSVDIAKVKELVDYINADDKELLSIIPMNRTENRTEKIKLPKNIIPCGGTKHIFFHTNRNRYEVTLPSANGGNIHEGFYRTLRGAERRLSNLLGK